SSMPPIARLLTVEKGPAGTCSGSACASAAKTTSMIRWLTSAAQPDTGRGGFAQRKVSSGTTKRQGSNEPAVTGTAGKMCLSAIKQAEIVVGSTQFIGPAQGGDEPLKSNDVSSPETVSASAISSGSGTTPSESRWSTLR